MRLFYLGARPSLEGAHRVPGGGYWRFRAPEFSGPSGRPEVGRCERSLVLPPLVGKADGLEVFDRLVANRLQSPADEKY